MQAGIEAHWRADRVLHDLEPSIARFAKRNMRFKQVHERLTDGRRRRRYSVDAFDGEQTLWNALQLATTPRAMAAAWVLDATGALEYRDRLRGCWFGSETSRSSWYLPNPPVPRLAQQSSASESFDSSDSEPEKIDSDEAAALRDEITARHEQLDKLNYYELLEVEPNASSRGNQDLVPQGREDGTTRMRSPRRASITTIHQQANSVFRADQ